MGLTLHSARTAAAPRSEPGRVGVGSIGAVHQAVHAERRGSSRRPRACRTTRSRGTRPGRPRCGRPRPRRHALSVQRRQPGQQREAHPELRVARAPRRRGRQTTRRASAGRRRRPPATMGVLPGRGCPARASPAAAGPGWIRSGRRVASSTSSSGAACSYPPASSSAVAGNWSPTNPRSSSRANAAAIDLGQAGGRPCTERRRQRQHAVVIGRKQIAGLVRRQALDPERARQRHERHV